MTEGAVQAGRIGTIRRTAAADHVGLGAAAAAWVLWALDFNVLAITDGDADRQFRLMRRLFGEDVDATAYHFGLALLEAPFYALGKLLSAAGAETVDGVAMEHAAVALGSSACVLATMLLCGLLLARLELPYRGTAIFLALFGMPLFYYGSFNPGRTHAYDTLLFTLALVLLLAYLRSPANDVRLVVALGAVLGVAATVRYFNAPALIALLLGLAALRRWRDAVVLGATAAAVAGGLALVPLIAGVPLTSGVGTRGLGFDPTVWLKMLFSDQRGLFVWSPVALVGAIGYAHLVRRTTPDRLFYVLAASMGIAILIAYGAHVEAWDGRWSFSQRFLTPLFPLVAIGVAALAAIRPRVTIATASLATAWTVFLALNLHTVGAPNDDYDALDAGALELAVQPAERDIGPGEYLWGLQHASRVVP